MLQEERQKKILFMLEEQGFVSIADLTKVFECSRETIRRDLDAMEKTGNLEKVRGGAVSLNPNNELMTFRFRHNIHKKEKKEMARKACEFVNEGAVIAMNSGTCTHFIARELKKHFSRLTFITLSLPTVMELIGKKDFSVVVPGGVVNPDEMALVGAIAENSLKNFHIDLAFVAPGGISLGGGITEYLTSELPIEKILLEQAENVFVVVEHQKIDKNCMLKIAGYENINGIITDSACPDEVIARYGEKDIHVIRAEAE